MTSDLSRADLKKMYVEFLTAEGFLPDLSQDDFVMFMRGGQTYGIAVDDDAECFDMYTPVFDLTDDTDPSRLRAAALRANDATRVAKLYIDGRLLIGVTQQFCNPPGNFQAIFHRCLAALEEVSAAFKTNMES